MLIRMKQRRKMGWQWIEQWEQIRKAEDAQKHKAAETLDGRHIDVVCNIAKPEDAKLVLENGGEGVGLLRTEFLFESSTAEPTVEAQCDSLKAIVKELGSRQLIVRTADIGGDKPVSWLHIPHENNPFLGMRGIRLSFKYEDDVQASTGSHLPDSDLAERDNRINRAAHHVSHDR